MHLLPAAYYDEMYSHYYIAGYPRACYRSVSWVRVPPSAHSHKFAGIFSCAQIDSRKARKRESMRDKNWMYVPGGRREDTGDHSLSRSCKVKVSQKKGPKYPSGTRCIYIYWWYQVLTHLRGGVSRGAWRRPPDPNRNPSPNPNPNGVGWLVLGCCGFWRF